MIKTISVHILIAYLQGGSFEGEIIKLFLPTNFLDNYAFLVNISLGACSHI